MNRIATFTNSSVGRKLLMGLTGFFLCSFLVVHLYINLFLFKSDQGGTFDAYSEFMATYPLIRPLEILLFAGFLFHMFLGVWLWLLNRRVRPQKYAVNRAADNSALTSRIMFVTGVILTAFLVVHVNTFFVRSRFLDHSTPMYTLVKEAFINPWYDAFYLVALVVLGYHLKHGVQSAFQTYGLRAGRWQKWIDLAGILFWLIIPLAFASMPLYFLWAHLTGVN
jgi:succinate dehydrogenase / fumarate reductase, cytochrome b subunit